MFSALSQAQENLYDFNSFLNERTEAKEVEAEGIPTLVVEMEKIKQPIFVRWVIRPLLALPIVAIDLSLEIIKCSLSAIYQIVLAAMTVFKSLGSKKAFYDGAKHLVVSGESIYRFIQLAGYSPLLFLFKTYNTLIHPSEVRSFKELDLPSLDQTIDNPA